MSDLTTDLTTTERELERVRRQRDRLRLQHAQALARLMEERADLKGVHAHADFVSDSVLWSA